MKYPRFRDGEICCIPVTLSDFCRKFSNYYNRKLYCVEVDFVKETIKSTYRKSSYEFYADTLTFCDTAEGIVVRTKEMEKVGALSECIHGLRHSYKDICDKLVIRVEEDRKLTPNSWDVGQNCKLYRVGNSCAIILNKSY